MAKKILVVDDDLFIREIYVDALKQADYEVDSAVNGEEGLAEIKKGGYDLILLDYHLPKMNGTEILSDLSQNPPSIQNGPIILLTNTEPEEVIQECLKNGASSYLTKVELTPEDLINNVNRLLN